MQMSPIHINYVNEGMIGCEAAGFNGEGWKAMAMRSSAPRSHHNSSQRNSFMLPCDFLDEADEGNFIVPDPVYNEDVLNGSCDRFQDVIDTPSASMMSVNSSAEQSTRRRRKRYRDHRRSRHSIENETLLMQDIAYDVSKGARPKVYYSRKNHQDSIGEEEIQNQN